MPAGDAARYRDGIASFRIAPERLRFAPEIAVAALAVAAAIFVAGRAFGDGFPLDDAWIHLQYGLALRKTGTLGYNDGIASTGCTSPLWAILCAGLHLFAGGAPSMTAATIAKGLGVALHAAASVLSARLARALVPHAWEVPAAIGAGGVVATSSVLAFAAVSGMEVGLAATLLLAAALAAVRSRAILAGALIGLAVAARPECVVLVPAIALVVAVRATLKDAAKALVAASVPIVALVARNYVVSKLPLPATFYVKSNPEAQTFFGSMQSAFVDLLGKLRPTSNPAFWIFVVAALGVGAWALGRFRERRDAFAIGALAAGALAFLAGAARINVIRNPSSFYYQRYFAPPLPLLIVAAVCAAIVFADLALRRARAAFALALVFAAAIVDDVVALRGPRARYADDVTSINALQVATGKFVRDHISPEGVVWTVDAGAVRYWGQRRTVDLVRLNTREVFHGNKVPKEWWPEAIVTIPEVFQAFAPDGLVDAAFSTQSPIAPDPSERQMWRHEVYVCRKNANEHPDNRVLVLLYKEQLVAVGRCAPK